MAKIYETITLSQERFLLALLEADSVADAARKSDTPETTARRWLRRSDVRAAWLDLRRQTTEGALLIVQRAMAEAARTLSACMGAKMPPGVRLAASKSILELGVHGLEVEDLGNRVQLLEEALADQAALERQSNAAGGAPTLMSQRPPVKIHA